MFITADYYSKTITCLIEQEYKSKSVDVINHEKNKYAEYLP